jgi:hypothetical protein
MKNCGRKHETITSDGSVQVVSLLTHYGEEPGQNIVQNTDYPAIISKFPQSPHVFHLFIHSYHALQLCMSFGLLNN